MNPDAFGLELSAIKHDGKTFFHLLDVVRALRTQHPKRIISNLDADEFVSLAKITGDELDAETYLVTEPAVYKIALRMRSDEARAFLRFVCHDVLPSLRERSAYRLPPRCNADGSNLVRYLATPIADAQSLTPQPARADEADLPW
jgi:prophage antirepressor-like protein